MLCKAGLVVIVGELYYSGHDVIFSATVPSQTNKYSICDWYLTALR